jgi:hypothetical protein
LLSQVIKVLDASGEVEISVSVGNGVAFVKHNWDFRILGLNHKGTE